MYTINGNYIKNIKKNNKIIENMNNSNTTFNSLKFTQKNKPDIELNYFNDKLMLIKDSKKEPISTLLDLDFANKTMNVYSNLNIENNMIFYPSSNETVQEIDKGIIFYNKNQKIVGSIHKDNKDRSDLVFRTGYSNESAFGLTERLRIKNGENRVKVSGSLDADQICLGDVCLNKNELKEMKSKLTKKNMLDEVNEEIKKSVSLY